MFCSKCGTENADDGKFCNNCGHSLQTQTQQNNQQQQQEPNNSTDSTNSTNSNISNNFNINGQNIMQNEKTMAIVAYFLFFVPLLTVPDSKFARYHANQGLILLLSEVTVGIVRSILYQIFWSVPGLWTLWWLFSIIFTLLPLALLVPGIIGIMNAANNKTEPMPVIGSLFTIIK